MSADVKIPEMGESITEVQIGEWRKAENDSIASGEDIVSIESEKATLELPAPVGGRLAHILKHKGDFAKVGEVIAQIETDEGASNGASPKAKAPPAPITEAKTPPPPTPAPPAAAKTPSPSAAPPPEKPKEQKSKPATDQNEAKAKPQQPDPPAPVESPEPEKAQPETPSAAREPSPNQSQEEVVPMTILRRAAARRLLEAQHNAALLTTFNEADLSAVIALRRDFGDAFRQKHGVKLGFMSFFVKASVDALKHIPQINAEIRGNDIIFKNHFDICIAISSGRGLVAPVLRNAERLSFAEIETAIAGLAASADSGTLRPDDLAGGTFTITNGGVFGSLLSTPIVNPPQSGVLGMHTIQDRPVAVSGSVVVRPMMYLALTYDHRIVDGREAVQFLKRVKDTIETPARMLIEA